MSSEGPQVLSAIDHVLHEVFGFQEFRGRQREVCLSAWRGRDALLVMPTGAGKSLCYQLPTIARQEGRAIVISPLIALIEDQVQKLQKLNLPADRIHSGRQRAESQQACRAWREGQLKFLFVAPERFSVPGFLEFLVEHKPALIAVDEAHCISMWGHDFRGDYRALGPRLAKLRPANIVALTATATPEVQRDIVTQLEMKQADIFIHGFRRDNIAINVMEVTAGARVDGAINVLKEKERRPAIVYAPTRKLAESAALTMGQHFRTGVFHAGMAPQDRQVVQTAFLNDEIEVMVATIAFGMGVDKPNVRTVVHLALPSSVESYYQEIGRAGRDGQMSAAVLFYSGLDRKTHEYFLELNYPEPDFLSRVLIAIQLGSSNKDEIAARLGSEPDQVRFAVEKLWIHAGVTVSENGALSPGKSGWEKRYLAQRRHRRSQLAKVFEFASHTNCRMKYLISHFGDKDDQHIKCGICDRCQGTAGFLKTVDRVSPADLKRQQDVMLALVPHQSKTSGQIFTEHFADLGWSRPQFEDIVFDLESQKMLFKSIQSFVKNGETIEYKRIGLTDHGRDHLFKIKLAPSPKLQSKKLQSKSKSSKKSKFPYFLRRDDRDKEI